MEVTTSTTSSTNLDSAAVASGPAAAVRLARWQGLAALLIGAVVVFGAGFAWPSAIHNATHDTRHAFGLPCH